MQPAMIKCSRFELELVISKLKADNPKKYWGLTDYVQPLDADSLWIGCGAFRIEVQGEPVGYFLVRHDRKGFLVEQVLKLPRASDRVAQMVVQWLTTQYPGALLRLDCFDDVLPVWLQTNESARVVESLPFSPSLAPFAWSSEYGFPRVHHVRMRLSGFDSEGSY